MTDYMVVLHTSDAKTFVHFINFKTNFTLPNRPLKRFLVPCYNGSAFEQG